MSKPQKTTQKKHETPGKPYKKVFDQTLKTGAYNF